MKTKQESNIINLKDKASERGFCQPTGPFLIEPFCAQVAWMGVECPLYPPTAAEKKDICRFLIEDGYENYRCPALGYSDERFSQIIKNGTEEQKRALEFLADMSIRYAQSPVGEHTDTHLELTNYRCVGDTIHIYEDLGLKDKLENAKIVWRKLTTTNFTAEDIERAKKSHEDWEKRQAEVEKNSADLKKQGVKLAKGEGKIYRAHKKAFIDKAIK